MSNPQSPDRVHWQARWIKTHVIGGPRTVPPAAYLRREFELTRPVRSAVLHVTALGVYEPWLNGATVGDHVLAPGWTEYDKRVYFQSHDVSGRITAGRNVLGVILGDGWYTGHLAWRDRQVYGPRPLLLAQLEVTHDDGGRTVIGTDERWRASTGPILENDLLMGESYDARLDLGPWCSAGYDESRWLPVLHGDVADGLVVEPSPAPPVRRIQTLTPVAAPDAPDGPTARRWAKERVFDLGQNLTGRVRIRVKAAPGRHLVLRHAEVLDEKGNLYFDNLRRARATDQYTCASGGEETWEPRFTFHGFRYVQVQGLRDGDACEVTAVVLHTDMKPSGRFECSHPLLNQLEHNILWGQKGNFLDIPTDCPQRDERLGWSGDAQVFIRTACSHYDVSGFFHKWLQTMRDSQHPSGALASFYPHLGTVIPENDGGPAWSDAAFVCPWLLYQWYGQASFLADHYDCMTRYMDYLAAQKVRDFIRCHPDIPGWRGYGDWLALDGSGTSMGGTAKDLIGTAFYAYDADIMAQAAALLGKSRDVERWRGLHGQIVSAFQQRYITARGLIVGGTQTAYVLALHFDLVPPPLRDAAAGELVRLIRTNGNRLATGFVGTPYLLHVLEATGHLDVAYTLLEQEAFPSWLFPVKHGATTIWERWDGWTPEKGFQDKGMNSFNHYAYGAVGDWMLSTVAGLQFDTQRPGFRHTIFKPRPGGTLTHAAAELDTPHGRAAIRWRLDGDRLHIDLTVPERGTGTLSLPDGWTADGAALDPGTHSIVARRR